MPLVPSPARRPSAADLASLPVAADPDRRECWVVLSVAPLVILPSGEAFDLSPAAMDRIVEGFESFAPDWEPALMSFPHTDSAALGYIKRLVRWTWKGDGKERLVALVRWTPPGWRMMLDGTVRYISPSYRPKTDGKGAKRLTLFEVSATSTPVQTDIWDVQTLAAAGGAQHIDLSEPKPMDPNKPNAPTDLADDKPDTPTRAEFDELVAKVDKIGDGVAELAEYMKKPKDDEDDAEPGADLSEVEKIKRRLDEAEARAAAAESRAEIAELSESVTGRMIALDGAALRAGVKAGLTPSAARWLVSLAEAPANPAPAANLSQPRTTPAHAGTGGKLDDAGCLRESMRRAEADPSLDQHALYMQLLRENGRL